MRLGVRMALVSGLGRDAEGETLLAEIEALPVDLGGVTRSDTAPSAFHLIALEADGEMMVAVADMRVYDEMTPALLQALPDALWAVDALFADCNLPAETLGWLAAQRSDSRLFVANGVSPAKARRRRDCLGACDVLFVNYGEAAALVEGVGEAPEALARALAAARLTLACAESVNPTLTPAALDRMVTA